MSNKIVKKVVIWGGWYGSHNIGDQILLLSITDLLQKFLNCEFDFTVLTDNADWVREYTARESNSRIYPVQSKQEINLVVKSIKNCDLFIFGGGVPFYDQAYHAFVMGFLSSLMQIYQRPCLLWSVSSQVVRSKFALFIYKHVLSRARAITYRDDHTRQLFIHFGVHEKSMCMAPDPGFTLDWHDHQQKGIEILKQAGCLSESRPLFGLTPRFLRTKDRESETHYESKTPSQYQLELDCYVAAVDWLWEHGYQPVFVPMNSIGPDDDRIATRDVVRKAQYGVKAIALEDSISPKTAPSIYQLCQGSFVSRVHGSITSMLGNCPMMMYSFMHKHSGIMDMMDMSDFCMEEANASPELTIQLLEKLLNQRQGLQEKLSKHLLDLKREARIPIEQAAEILKLEMRY